MYNRLLIPLDGSRMAESILPVAVCLSGALQTSIALIHIIEKNAPQEVHGDRHLHDASAAEDYLNQIVQQWFSSVQNVETHVHSEEVENVPHSILQHVREYNSDLTLMCTHGHVGARQILYGSIAQQIAASSVPVLFIRADSAHSESEFVLKKLLVPLDGDPDHEQGLRSAVELARVCHSSIHMLTVVPHLGLVSGSWTQSARLLPKTTDRLLGMEAGASEEYLNQHQQELGKREIVASAEVRRGDPADEIVNATTSIDANLIVVGTHGTIGTEAFWMGSVAAKVARKTVAPVLLVPAASGSR